MTFTMFVMWVLVGLLAGLLAGLVMKRGGYGLKKDILFGVGGSIALSWLLRGLGIITGTGMVVAALVAVIGAVIPIVAQRKIWPTERLGEHRSGEDTPSIH